MKTVEIERNGAIEFKQAYTSTGLCPDGGLTAFFI
jgi:hypothetical protein